MKSSPIAIVVQTIRLITLSLFLALAACSSPEEKAEAHLERAQELLKAKDYTSASLEFRNAIKFNEKLTSAWLGLVEVLEHQQNWRGVASGLRKALELDSSLVEPHIKLGRLYSLGNAKSVEKALEHANKANELKPNDSAVIALRAAILMRLDDRTGARRDAERVLELSPESTEALSVLAADRMMDDDTKGALSFIDRGLAVRAVDVNLLQLKARIFAETKDETNLELVLRKLVSFYPDVRVHRLRLIRFLTAQKRHGEAEAELRTLASAHPDDTQLSLQLVQYVRSHKGSKKAEAELKKLGAAKPDVADFNLALAELKFAESGLEGARPILDDLISKSEKADDSQRARVQLARMLLRSRKTDEAKKLLEEALVRDEKNADALSIRATIRLEANDTENAITDLREALAQQPRSVNLLLLLGRAFERQGSKELAEDNYARAAKFSNYATATTLEYVRFLTRHNKPVRAEQVLAEGATRNPSAQLLTALAQMRVRKQDWVGAIEVAKKMRDLGVAKNTSEQILGVAQIGQKDFDAGIATFKNLYEQLEGGVRPMLVLASAYVHSGKLEQAEQFLQSVLTANQRNASAHVMMGSLRSLQKKPEQAEAAYKRAIEAEPENQAGHIYLARLYTQQNRLKEAEDVLKRSIDTQPKNANLYRTLSQFYAQQKNLEASEAVLKAGRTALPNNLGLGLLLAGVLEQRDDIEGAIGHYEELLEVSPAVPILSNNLASLLVDHRTDDESLQRARKLADGIKRFKVPHFKDTIGWIEYRLGNYRIALANLQEASQKLPKLGLVRFHLGMTYAALERSADAKRELDEALELSKDDPLLAGRIEKALGALPAN